MQQDAVEVVGLVAGFVGAFAFAPQAFKILRDRDGSTVSALTYSMVLIGGLMWIGYGLLRGLPSIVLWNMVSVGLAALVLTLKLRTPAKTARRGET